jgi:predicted MFS family arabinose efflux permease
LEAKKEIIVAEAKGGWLQKNWRPILMLSIVAIVVNNYIIYPYLSMFTEKVTMLDLPKQLWNLMLIGVGGYVTGRSGEKIAGKLSPNHNSNLKE